MDFLDIIAITSMLVGTIILALGFLNLKVNTIRRILQALLPMYYLCKNLDLILTGAWFFLLGILILIMLHSSENGSDISGPVGLYITLIILIQTICETKRTPQIQEQY